VSSPDLLDQFAKLSMKPGGGTPAETRTFIMEETQRWSKVIRAANIKPE